MRTSFDLIADTLLARGPDAMSGVTSISDWVRLSGEFSAAAAYSSHSEASPLRITLLVCAPACSPATVARHLVASLAAGNAVELVLFESPSALLAGLLTVVQEIMPLSHFSLVSEHTGWKMSDGDPTVIVLTNTNAFMNDDPGIWSQNSSGEAATEALIDFYS